MLCEIIWRSVSVSLVVMAHDIAMRVCVEITDRQGLHAGKHVIANFLECTLRNIDHQPVVSEIGRDADEINASHNQNCPQ